MDDSTNPTRSWFTAWLMAVSFQTVFAVVGLCFPAFFGYTSQVRPFGDVAIYQHYAEPILEGKLPFRDYVVEYPILAIPVFLLPRIAGASFEAYRSGFVGLMLVVNAAIGWQVARRVGESAGVGKVAGRLVWYSLYFAALCPLIVARYDLVPTLLAFAAACAMSRGRVALGGVLAGLGMLVKVVPGLVFLPFLVARGSLRPKITAVLAIGSTVGLGVLAWWWLAGDRWLGMFRYHGERGIEIESLYGSAYLLVHKLAGLMVINHFDHGSMNLYAAGARDAAKLSVILQGALLLLIAGRARDSAPGQEIRFATAALLAYLVAGKVLSPQYLVWLIPFVGAIEGPTGLLARWIFLACCVLTTAIFPWTFRSLIEFHTLPVVILTARNVLLLVLFVVVLGRRGVTPTRLSPEACS